MPSRKHHNVPLPVEIHVAVDPPDVYVNNNGNTSGYASVKQAPVSTWRRCECGGSYFGTEGEACEHDAEPAPDHEGDLALLSRYGL